MNAKILTNIKEPRVAKQWAERTSLLPGSDRPEGILKALIGVSYLILWGKNFDVIVLSGKRLCMIFTALAALLPLRYPPVIFVDCLWYLPTTHLKMSLKTFQLKLVNRTVAKFIVWSSHEIEDYANAFGIPKEKFEFIHHHHTLESFDFKVKRGEYLFAGGDGDRDYPTLLKAVEGLDVPVKIATRRTDWADNSIPPPNVQAFPTSKDDFIKCMSEAMIVVIPMKSGLLHSGGQQTYLNAMAMGKAVIVAGERGAADYIQNDENGFLVPSGDSNKLRSAIESLLNNQEKADYIAKNAAVAAEEYSTVSCIDRIIELAETTAAAWRRHV